MSQLEKGEDSWVRRTIAGDWGHAQGEEEEKEEQGETEEEATGGGGG